MPRFSLWALVASLFLSTTTSLSPRAGGATPAARRLSKVLSERDMRKLERTKASKPQRPAVATSPAAPTAEPTTEEDTGSADIIMGVIPKGDRAPQKQSTQSAQDTDDDGKPDDNSGIPDPEATPVDVPAAEAPITQVAAPTAATGETEEEREKEAEYEKMLHEELGRIQSRMNAKGAATFAAHANELREFIEDRNNQKVFKRDYSLQTRLIVALMIDLDMDDNRYDIPVNYRGTNEEITAAYKAGRDLYKAVLKEAHNLFADPKKLIKEEQQSAESRKEETEEDGPSWMDDENTEVQGKWFSNDEEDADRQNAEQTRKDPRRYGPSFQRRLDAFTQMIEHWENDKDNEGAAAKLQATFKESLPFIDYKENVGTSITALLNALKEESNRELVGKHPHLRRHLLFLPRHNRARPRGVLWRHVPPLTEKTRADYTKLLDLIDDNPNETGQSDLDDATQKLIKAHLQDQKIRVASAPGAEAKEDEGEIRPAEAVADDPERQKRQDPLGGKKVLVVLPDPGDAMYKELAETREGMHGDSASSFAKAARKIDRTISGRFRGVKDAVHKSEAVKSVLIDLLLIRLERTTIGDLSDHPYEYTTLGEEAQAQKEGLKLYEKVEKNWAKIFKSPDDAIHQDFDRWSIDIDRRKNALSYPLTAEMREDFVKIIGWCRQLRKKEMVEEGAQALEAFLQESDNRGIIGDNPWMRARFFSNDGIVIGKADLPPLTRQAKESLLSIIKLIKKNPRDTGMRELPKMRRTVIEKSFDELTEAITEKRATDRIYDTKELEEADDATNELGNVLYTSWPPNKEEPTAILVAKKNTMRKNFTVIMKWLKELEEMLDKRSYRNKIATAPELREKIAHIVLCTQQEVVRQRSSAPVLVEQIESELSVSNREKLSEQLVELVLLLKEYSRELNLQDEFKKLLTPQLYILYSMQKPLTREATLLRGDINGYFKKLLAAEKELSGKKEENADAKNRATDDYMDALKKLYKLTLEDDGARKPIGEFPQLRARFFSDTEGLLAMRTIPESLRTDHVEFARTFLKAVTDNPNDLGYAERPRLKNRIERHIDQLMASTEGATKRRLLDALDKYVPRLRNIEDERTFGRICAILRRTLREVLKEDKDFFDNHPRLRERLFSYENGFMVLKDIPENLSDISKAAATGLLDELMDLVGDDEEFTKADLERMKRDIENKQKADLAAREAAEKAEEEAERKKEEAEDEAERKRDEAQEREDRSLSLSGGSRGRGGRSRDDISTGGGYRSGGGGSSGPFDFEQAKRDARRMPWFKQATPPLDAPRPDEDMKKSDWAMSIYNYAWQNEYRYYYGGEIATYIKGLDDAINTSKFKTVLSMVGLGGRNNIRKHDKLAKALVYFLIKPPETLPIIPDPKDQKIVADFYTDILKNDRLFETRRTDQSLELKQRLNGILENIPKKEGEREQMLEGLPNSIKLPLRYNPRFVNAIADAKFNRSLQRTQKNVMAQNMMYGGMMPGGFNPAFAGQGTMHPMRPGGRLGPHMPGGIAHHPMAGGLIMPGMGMYPRGYPPYGHGMVAQPPQKQQPIVINVQAPSGARPAPAPHPHPPSPLMRAAQGRVHQVRAANAFQQAGQRRQAHRASQAFGGAQAQGGRLPQGTPRPGFQQHPVHGQRRMAPGAPAVRQPQQKQPSPEQKKGWFARWRGK